MKTNLELSHPTLCLQWHPTLNEELKPTDVTSGSAKKVWWTCSEGADHIWQATISNRANGTSCPFCSGKRVSSNNSLKTTHPDLALEWHPIRNGDLKPDQVSRGSSKWVWWRCSTNNAHEWKTRVRTRGVGGGVSRV
tara:strand:- start:2327 stop:2737 length:411 start_codon:yes stop_codon:yes gene_type:complete